MTTTKDSFGMRSRQKFDIAPVILMVALSGISTGSIASGFLSGNRLKEHLSNTAGAYDQAFATGFIIGVADSHANTLSCPPVGVTARQIVEVAQKYLNENPEKLHYSASSSVAVALMNAFPCKSKK